ncbi:MAG TPA: aminoacyl-tRNA hydrolase [Longimicrobium sp.]|nr:aminoacyl-tRNA hydrolase [Longimicrobium sp.]
MLERLRALLSARGEGDVAGAKVIVGLGNPGREYENTRHNAGWWLLDELARGWGVPRFRAEKTQANATTRVEPFQVRLIKPLTYMNRSGGVLVPLKRMNALDLTRDLLVIVDDVALDPGRVRFRASGSAGGHNGLKSIEQTLGTKDYPRLRLGVGQKPEGMDLAAWVLGVMPKSDRKLLEERFPDLVRGVEIWMRDGIEAAMDACNN